MPNVKPHPNNYSNEHKLGVFKLKSLADCAGKNAHTNCTDARTHARTHWPIEDKNLFYQNIYSKVNHR